jgi:hypothetical protein
MRAIDIYLNHFDGNQSQAAKALGKKQQNVWGWLRKSPDMPLHLVPAAAKIIGKKPHELRPDVFEPPA